MDINEMGTSLVIVVLAYFAGIVAKAVPNIPDKLIPVIVGAVGGILGACGMFIIPDYPATDIMSAIAVGIVSGLASTGVHQAYKQITQE